MVNKMLGSKLDKLAEQSKQEIANVKKEFLTTIDVQVGELKNSDQGLTEEISKMKEDAEQIKLEWGQQLAVIRKNLKIFMGISAALFGGLVILLIGGWL